MNFSITSAEQSLQVFTATLIRSPFCFKPQPKNTSVDISANSKVCNLYTFASACKENILCSPTVDRQENQTAQQGKFTHVIFVNSIVNFPEKTLTKDSAENNVTSVDPVLHD